jgi:hypothetical protein
MKIIFSIALILSVFAASSQEAAKASFRKYPVASTGCNIYFPAPPDTWTLEKSQDSSDVYTNSVTCENLVFDAIVVKLAQSMDDLSKEEKQDLLISYLDYLKGEFKVTETAGYGRGQILEGNDAATGVLDFWKFDDGSQGKVKAWANDTHLAVLLVSWVSDPSDKSITDVFLNGFRFPE